MQHSTHGTAQLRHEPLTLPVHPDSPSCPLPAHTWLMSMAASDTRWRACYLGCCCCVLLGGGSARRSRPSRAAVTWALSRGRPLLATAAPAAAHAAAPRTSAAGGAAPNGCRGCVHACTPRCCIVVTSGLQQHKARHRRDAVVEHLPCRHAWQRHNTRACCHGLGRPRREAAAAAAGAHMPPTHVCRPAQHPHTPLAQSCGGLHLC
jgi:hypothetical protein